MQAENVNQDHPDERSSKEDDDNQRKVDQGCPNGQRLHVDEGRRNVKHDRQGSDQGGNVASLVAVVNHEDQAHLLPKLRRAYIFLLSQWYELSADPDHALQIHYVVR